MQLITTGYQAEKFVIGVDVGGTKVAAGIVASEGEIMTQTRVPSSRMGTQLPGLPR